MKAERVVHALPSSVIIDIVAHCLASASAKVPAKFVSAMVEMDIDASYGCCALLKEPLIYLFSLYNVLFSIVRHPSVASR